MADDFRIRRGLFQSREKEFTGTHKGLHDSAAILMFRAVVRTDASPARFYWQKKA
jgi:hypothetical protein